MTVTYTADVATSKLGTFIKLLRRWRGSVYKLLWKDFLIFVILYYIINLIYRFALDEYQKRLFEQISIYCDAYNNLIPVAFVLGFYVSVILSRWWDQLTTIPFPDRMAIFVSACVHGHDDRGRLMRRTIMRYFNLSLVLTLSSISRPVKKRFPTLEHLIEAGLMHEDERKVYDAYQTPHNKYYVPLIWATALISRARKEMRIKDDMSQQTLMMEVNNFRGQLGMLMIYDYISMPLVYTQVVTLAVQAFFISCLMGRQFLDPKQGYANHTVDIYVPVFTFLQFFFYMGWLKVAESLCNPFGEDDDDFEANSTIDRNVQIAYMIVDDMHSEHPEMTKDAYWDQTDFEIPYTVAAEPFRTEVFMGSTNEITVPPADAVLVTEPMETITEEKFDPGEVITGITIPTNIPMAPKRTQHQPSSLNSHNSQKGISRRLVPSFLRRTLSRETSIRSETSPRSPSSAVKVEEEIFNMSDLNISRLGDDDFPEDQVSEELTPQGTRHVPLSTRSREGIRNRHELGPEEPPNVNKSISDARIPHTHDETEVLLPQINVNLCLSDTRTGVREDSTGLSPITEGQTPGGRTDSTPGL